MANAIKNVKFTNDYDVEAADIERQRKMAEALQQQGMAPAPGTQSVGGWAIPQSPLEGVGRVAQQVAGKYQQDKLTERQKALAEAMRTKGNDEAQQFVGALQGTSAQPEVPMPADELGGGPGRPEMAAVPGDRNRALAIAMQSQNPMVQAGGGSIMADMLKRPTTKTVDMGDKIGVFDDRGALVGSFPKGNTPDAVLKDTTTRAKTELAPSGVAFNPYQTKPGDIFNDPNKIMNLDAFGRPVVNNPYVDAQKDIKAAGKPVTNVNVKTDVKTGESLAAQVGPMMKDSTTIAEGAVKQIDAAQRIIKAVDSGKIITGPTAGARMTANQVGQTLGISGKDEAERIANTRQAMRGLAELTLQGRQQMKGQGAITESEGKLAERAMSGDIEMTAAEIKQLAKASERTARFNHAEHARKLAVMQQNPALQGIAPFYQGPAMPPEVPDAPGPAAVSPLTQQYLDRVNNGR